TSSETNGTDFAQAQPLVGSRVNRALLFFLFLHLAALRLRLLDNLVLQVLRALLSMPWMRPRRLLRSPMMVPANSSGMVISTVMIGSSSVGLACSMALRKAMRPAIWKERSF